MSQKRLTFTFIEIKSHLMPHHQQTISPENGTWDFAPEGWKQLYGSFPTQGISIEWHDFEASQTIPWDKSFHDESIEICLNLEGRAEICRQGVEVQLPKQSIAFYPKFGS